MLHGTLISSVAITAFTFSHLFTDFHAKIGIKSPRRTPVNVRCAIWGKIGVLIRERRSWFLLGRRLCRSTVAVRPSKNRENFCLAHWDRNIFD